MRPDISGFLILIMGSKTSIKHHLISFENFQALLPGSFVHDVLILSKCLNRGCAPSTELKCDYIKVVATFWQHKI